MNNLVLNETGGLNLTQEQLDFLQKAFAEAISGVAGSFSGSAGRGYILNGGTIYQNGGTHWLTEGFAVVKLGLISEVFYIANHNTGVADSVAVSDLYWKELVANISPSPVTYKDGTTHNINKQRRLTLATSSVNFFPKYNETPLLKDAINELLVPGDWIAAPAYQNSWANSALPVKYNKQFGYVTIIGGASQAAYTTTTSDLIFTLPTGYRPLQKQVFHTYDAVASKQVTVEIETNGQVKYKVAGQTAVTSALNFDGWCRFPTV